MELVGISEIAEIAGVTRQAVANWRVRHKNFPSPIVELKSGPIWNREEINLWLKEKDGNMTKIISFINLKGGVGKTTSAVAVSEFLAQEYKKNVLLIDLDPQTNATVSLISEKKWEELDKNGQTLFQLFQDQLDQKEPNKFDIGKSIVRGVSNIQGGIPRLSLLPSSLGLIEIQDQLALIPGGAFYAVSPVDILKSVLLPIQEEFDYIIIDCPPNLGIVTLNGINISNGYVIPVIPDILSTYGIPQIVSRIKKFSETKSIVVPPKGVIVSKFRAQSALHKTKLKQLQRDANTPRLPAPIFEAVIPEAARIAEAADVSAPIKTLRQKYGYGNNYSIYSKLTEEFIDKC